MKKLFTLCMALGVVFTAFTQTDTTGRSSTPNDTIRIGGIVIVRKGGKNREILHDREYRMRNRQKTGKPTNVSTNWWILDLGFSALNDNTNYGNTAAQAYAPGSNETWFDTKTGKSRNVNLWFFMQKMNIAKHVLNFKYGVGLEMNNYHFKRPIRFDPNPPAIPSAPVVSLDATPDRSYKKDKLAADYLTVPMMLNVDFTPKRKKSFGFSAGVSVGYLYSARNKTITSDEGKKKAKDDFDLQRWKLAYVAELSLGPVRFYGSYAFKSLFERGLDITPYQFGFRFSNW